MTELRKPGSGLLKEGMFALFADYYELTMAMADFANGNNNRITENYFFRKIPQGSYAITAGLEQVVDFVLNARFTEEDIEWLMQAKPNADFDENFADYLRNFRFHLDIDAITEGTPVFPGEPIMNITGPSIEVQLLETYLLNIMNFQTLVATKSARVVEAAEGKTVLDFGSRRAHGRDAAMLGARAATIGGVKGTSLVAAGREFDIPYVGTMAHKFVMDRPDELTAFNDYCRIFPHNAILLIDTYDTLQGARNAVTAGKELEERFREQGYKLTGVRLDSGNLEELSKGVRKILDDAGMQYAKIFASNDLDEFEIDRLLKAGAPIVTGANYNPLTGEGGVSAFGGVYKIVEREETGGWIPKIKFSSETAKMTQPGRKQTWRVYGDDPAKGDYERDVIALAGEEAPARNARPLMVLITKATENGTEQAYDFPSVKEIAAYSMAERQRLPKQYRLIEGSARYSVEISKCLENMIDMLKEKYQKQDIF
ncbi:MAG: nicotinate phosphoribosyltransferase [Candidatus Woesearchaeota archaeon]|nr:nicotinate phosphoribosyltransferase [Candidatus Woesearchaeota archaeon]